MTITSSLNAGVMGLNVNATRLATISNNIANSATYGYKRVDVDFSSMVVNQRPSTYSAGGVRAQAFREVSDAGTLINTGRSTDIAVNGNGMIPVTTFSGVDAPAEERQFLMTQTGGFVPDEDGYLRTNSGLFLMGWRIDDDGQPITGGRGNQGGLVPVNLNEGSFVADPTNSINLGVNVPADVSDITPGDTFDIPVEYFDPVGLAQTLDLEFTPPAANGGDWTITLTDNAQTPAAQVASFTASFNGDGTLGGITPAAGATYDAATGNLTFNVATGPIDLFTGRPNTTEGLSQIGTSFQPQNVSSDGAPAGQLQDVEITQDGRLEAIYSTGTRRTLFQIPIAEVNNPDGLQAVGNQAFRISATSGDFYLWDAGDGPAGTISGFSLMESNTDVASELTALIETQRAYSSNAKIIQTVDEMLQETTNLKR